MSIRATLIAAGLLSCCCLADSAAAAAKKPAATPTSNARTAPEAVRLQRLEKLAALWGEIRYFHPALATRDIDWDRALVETIPRVEAAKSPAQYRAALDQMLALIHDPATRTLPASPTAAAPAASAAPDLGTPASHVRTRDGIVRIDFTRLAEIADAGGSSTAMYEALEPAIAAMTGAKVVVIDARAPREIGDSHSEWMLSELLKAGSNAPLLLGALRYRQYNGYVSQTGSLSSGGYTAGMATERPVQLDGAGQAPLPPLVFLVNAHSDLAGEVLSGLQATGRARIIAEGADGTANVGANPYAFDMGEGVRAQLRTTELVAPDGSTGFTADAISDTAGMEAALAEAIAQLARPSPRVTRQSSMAGQLAANDRPYAEMTFPAREYRLLALFRMWNVIDKFYPYRGLIGPNWDDVLARYIPKFEANSDAIAYQMTLRELSAEIHDSHVGLDGTRLSAEKLGRYLPPAMPVFLEQRTVIGHVFDEGSGLRVGDEVLTVDGQPISSLRDRMAKITSGSTPQALMRNVHRSLFRGQKDSPIVLGVRGADGLPRVATLTRSIGADDPRLLAFDRRSSVTPVFGLLKDKVGYVDLARLMPAQVDAMFEAIKDAPATIFDMRGYPNGTAWPIAPRLTTRKHLVGALFRSPLPDGRSRANPDLRDSMQLTSQPLPEANGPPYLGRVVMLVNEWTQSQAESTALFFEAATKVTFIGSPTAGANGDVTELVLPGAISMQFSGHDVRHADGRQLQRVGIQPDLLVLPTIGGLVRGQDEVLEAAQAYLAGQGRPTP